MFWIITNDPRFGDPAHDLVMALGLLVVAGLILAVLLLVGPPDDR